MASTRLPGKVLADLAGKPLLLRVAERVGQSRLVERVVVATSDGPSDDPVHESCARQGIECFRGSEQDVLDRYYRAAKASGADPIVRITADCPFIDPNVVDKVVESYLEGGFDLVTNALRYTYPDGLDVEVFSAAALEQAWREATRNRDREHVTPYIRESGKFRIRNVENETDLSGEGHRWVVDEPADLQFARTVYERLLRDGKERFRMQDVLGLLRREPSLKAINNGIVRNEGAYLTLTREPPTPPRRRNLARSRALSDQAVRIIPSSTQTFSKGPTQFVQGVAPTFVVRGSGCQVWDVDENEYLDYSMGLGALILGHSHPHVTQAVVRQLGSGTTFSLPHPLEVEVAQLLVDVVPCAEMVRFGKNGSDVTAGAVRAARAFTGRDLIACCGYHGWQDWYIGTTTRRQGVPRAVQELTLSFQYNDIASLEALFAQHPGKIAAVIMEPVGVVEPQPGFLAAVRKLAEQEGALLIFDEVVSGFRQSLGGAQEYFGVIPDLACMGKAMGNGYPVAAVVGRRDVMRIFDQIFFSFTFGGETASLAAAKATIEYIRDNNVLEHIWEQGQRLRDGYNSLAKHYGCADVTTCIGYPPRTSITFRDAPSADALSIKSFVQQEAIKRGVLFTGAQNVSFSHTPKEVDATLRVYRTVLETLADAMSKQDLKARLEGPPVQPVFRRM